MQEELFSAGSGLNSAEKPWSVATINGAIHCYQKI
jgi:hypothetical protein